MCRLGHLFLVGLPLSGKSTRGRLLADALQRPFFDLDEEVCRVLDHASVADIFQQRGEAIFRMTEQAVLVRLLRRVVPFVLATGGGTPCYGEQMAHMNRVGYTLYLEMSWQLMAQRLRHAAARTRPLLTTLKSQHADALRQRFGSRLAYYITAHARFLVSAEPPEGQQQRLLTKVQEILSLSA